MHLCTCAHGYLARKALWASDTAMCITDLKGHDYLDGALQL